MKLCGICLLVWSWQQPHAAHGAPPRPMSHTLNCALQCAPLQLSFLLKARELNLCGGPQNQHRCLRRDASEQGTGALESKEEYVPHTSRRSKKVC